MRRAISPPTRTPSRRSAPAPATGRCRTAPASRSSCRRCIRASRRSRASACSGNLCRKTIDLARRARDHDLNFTVDAEEADRLELTLDVIAAVLADPSLRGWEGFGLAVQAYQKRAPAVIDWLTETARSLHRRLMVRLVKGAYWDTEVKRAQERGLAGYPVFTRKAMTDLCYDQCARQLIAARNHLYPQIATHNALTVASVIEDAGGVDGYEFQRLHGMGEVLYGALARRASRSCGARLRAGRRSPRSAGLSGAAAPGERRELVVRVGRGRSVGAGGVDPAASAKLDRRCRARAPSQDPAAARSLHAVRGAIRRVSSSAIARVSMRCWPKCVTPGCRKEAAPIIDGVAAWRRCRERQARRSTASRSGRSKRPMMPSSGRR